MQPGQNYFETCFLFLGLFCHFFLTLITRKLHFVVICHLRTVSFFHFRPFKQKDWWKTFNFLASQSSYTSWSVNDYSTGHAEFEKQVGTLKFILHFIYNFTFYKVAVTLTT